MPNTFLYLFLNMLKIYKEIVKHRYKYKNKSAPTLFSKGKEQQIEEIQTFMALET